MHLNVEQKKLVQARPGGHNLIKGVAGSGKTTVAVHRVSFLLNNYCYAPDDRVLLVTFNRTLINYISYLYNKVQGIEEYKPLFNNDSDKVDIHTIDSIIYRYFMEYKTNKKLKAEIIQDSQKYPIMAECLTHVREKYQDLKHLDQRNIRFFLDEIEWIKSCNYMEVEEYQSADRLGRMSKQSGDGPQKLQKNSNMRKAIYDLMLLYNNKLNSLGLIDFRDLALLAFEQAKIQVEKKYTHILVDESHDLTRVQIQFLKLLYQGKEASSFTFIADTAQSIYPHSWLVRGRSFTSIGFDMSGRSNYLTKNYRTTAQIARAAYSLLEAEPDIIEDEEYVRPSLIDRQGVFPVYRQFQNHEREGEFILRELSENIANKYDYRDIVIIAKNNNQLTYIKETLEKHDIPCILFNRKEVDFEAQAIRLLTIHSIKGLEFRVVFIIGLNNGIIPYSSYQDLEGQSAMEASDRKLLYVGMTRAHDILYLTSSANPPSRFIADIDPKLLKLSSQCLTARFYSVSLDDFQFKGEIIDLFSAEEKVRQWFLKELQDTYKYPVNLMEVEYCSRSL